LYGNLRDSYDNLSERSSQKNNVTTTTEQPRTEVVYDVYEDVRKIQNYYAESKFDEMLVVINHAMEMASTSEEKAQANYWMGVYYFNKELPDKAITYLEEVINLEPSYGGAYVTLGAVYSNKGDRNKAFQYAKKAVEVSPDNAWAHNGLGLAYYDLGDKVNAVKEIKEAIKLEPETALFKLNLRDVQN
jgi:tetratricopeptide (TPR) repeat protein